MKIGKYVPKFPPLQRFAILCVFLALLALFLAVRFFCTTAEGVEELSPEQVAATVSLGYQGADEPVAIKEMSAEQMAEMLPVSVHFFDEEVAADVARQAGMEHLPLTVQRLPPEDRPWVRRWFSSLAAYARQVLETRIGLLDWVLEKEDEDAAGVTGEQDF